MSVSLLSSDHPYNAEKDVARQQMKKKDAEIKKLVSVSVV